MNAASTPVLPGSRTAAGLLEVLPDVPPGQSSVSGTNIRIGTGLVDVAATHHG